MTPSKSRKRSAFRLFEVLVPLLIMGFVSAAAAADVGEMPHSFSAAVPRATATITFPKYEFSTVLNISGETAKSSTVTVTLVNGKSVSFHPILEGIAQWIPATGVIHVFSVPGQRYPIVAVTTGTCGNHSCGYNSHYYSFSKGTYNDQGYESGIFPTSVGVTAMQHAISIGNILGSHEETVTAVIPLLDKEYLVHSAFCGNESLIKYRPGPDSYSARLVKKGDVLTVSDSNPQSSVHDFVAYPPTKYGSDCIGGK